VDADFAEVKQLFASMFAIVDTSGGHSRDSGPLKPQPSITAPDSRFLNPASLSNNLYSHGGRRPFHQKSTCTTQLILWPYVMQIWSRNTLDSRGHETLVPNRVDVQLC
jgi:hypothetical protein